VVSITVNTVPTASNFSGTLDVNETLLTFAWKNTAQAADADRDALNASLGSNGDYGTFSILGDTLTYRKSVESNETDTAELIISDGEASVSVIVSVATLYWKQVATGFDHSAAIKSDGSLWLWGSNSKGQIGDGTLIDRLVPVHVTVEGNPTWKQVSAGSFSTLVIEDDGTLWAWGENISGQLGIGSYVDQKRPVEIVGSRWKQVSVGGSYTTGIQSDDTFWGWGLKADNTRKNVPEKIGNATWKRTSAGGGHVTGIQSDDTLWAWGYNHFGQLGDNTTFDKNFPVKIGNADWKMVAACNSHTVGIQSDGTLWAWGDNRNWQVGSGARDKRVRPLLIDDGIWKQAGGGVKHTVAIRSDDTLWGWGWNRHGQLGDGTNDPHRDPTLIGDATWDQIAVEGYYTVGIRSDGTLWAWGSNSAGQLGDGTIVDRNSPVPVSGRGL
jgi:hypothetical protein